MQATALEPAALCDDNADKYYDDDDDGDSDDDCEDDGVVRVVNNSDSSGRGRRLQDAHRCLGQRSLVHADNNNNNNIIIIIINVVVFGITVISFVASFIFYSSGSWRRIIPHAQRPSAPRVLLW